MNTSCNNTLRIEVADFQQPQDCQALRSLMQIYARDPMGGGRGLSEEILQALPGRLRQYPGAFTVLAWQGDTAVGLINCFETLSTFKAKPLINIHDVVVSPESRGLGISHRMLSEVERIARQRGCCKLTLEVLEGNQRAQQVYQDYGFSGYELDQQYGVALFWEKSL